MRTFTGTLSAQAYVDDFARFRYFQGPLINGNSLEHRGNSSVHLVVTSQEVHARGDFEKVLATSKHRAGIAQLVERHVANVKVAGSNPVSRSEALTWRFEPQPEKLFAPPGANLFLVP
jgi:hypothetical protein